MMSDNTILDL